MQMTNTEKVEQINGNFLQATLYSQKFLLLFEMDA